MSEILFENKNATVKKVSKETENGAKEYVYLDLLDENGNIKRLNNYHIKFSVEGEARLVANEETHTNPRPVEWGTAPILLRTTLRPGKVKVRAEVDFPGIQMPTVSTTSHIRSSISVLAL